MSSTLKRHQSNGARHFITFSCYRRLPYLDNDPHEPPSSKSSKDFAFGTSSTSSAMCSCRNTYTCSSPNPAHILATTLNVLKHETSQRLKRDRKQFWQTRYYDFNVLTQPKFVEKLRYLHRNPVTRGLVENPGDWPWSSYRHWLTGEAGQVEIESHWTWTRRERAGLMPNTWSTPKLPPYPPETSGNFLSPVLEVLDRPLVLFRRFTAREHPQVLALPPTSYRHDGYRYEIHRT